MPQSTALVRSAAWLALAVMVLGAIFPYLKPPLSIHIDWPLIVAYTLLFVCGAALHRRNGLPLFAIALLLAAAGAALFDTVENVLAYRRQPQVLVTSGKWICFHGSLMLLSPLLLLARGRFARVAGGLLVLAALAGLAALFGYGSMKTALSIMSVSLLYLIVVAVRDPRMLVR